MKQSFNGNLILKPYRKTRQLEEHRGATGFAMTKQKVGIEGLELLVDASVDSRYFYKGTVFHFKEETLYNQPWAKQIFENEEFPEGFIIGNMKDVVFVEEKSENS
jgi:hypothetical protein